MSLNIKQDKIDLRKSPMHIDSNNQEKKKGTIMPGNKSSMEDLTKPKVSSSQKSEIKEITETEKTQVSITNINASDMTQSGEKLVTSIQRKGDKTPVHTSESTREEQQTDSTRFEDGSKLKKENTESGKIIKQDFKDSNLCSKPTDHLNESMKLDSKVVGQKKGKENMSLNIKQDKIDPRKSTMPIDSHNQEKKKATMMHDGKSSTREVTKPTVSAKQKIEVTDTDKIQVSRTDIKASDKTRSSLEQHDKSKIQQEEEGSNQEISETFSEEYQAIATKISKATEKQENLQASKKGDSSAADRVSTELSATQRRQEKQQESELQELEQQPIRVLNPFVLGQSARLMGQVSAPRTRAIWHINGTPIEMPHRRYLSVIKGNTRQLIIHNIVESDFGDYAIYENGVCVGTVTVDKNGQ